jgi:hypothetical protein
MGSLGSPSEIDIADFAEALTGCPNVSAINRDGAFVRERRALANRLKYLSRYLSMCRSEASQLDQARPPAGTGVEHYLAATDDIVVIAESPIAIFSIRNGELLPSVAVDLPVLLHLVIDRPSRRCQTPFASLEADARSLEERVVGQDPDVGAVLRFEWVRSY